MKQTSPKPLKLLLLLLSLSLQRSYSFIPKCPPGCSTCKSHIEQESRETEIECIKCELTYRMEENKCKKCEVENCAGCPESGKICSECMREFFVFGMKGERCERCPENCEFCENSRSCNKCLFGYMFDQSELKCKFSYVALLEIFFAILAFLLFFWIISKFWKNRKKKEIVLKQERVNKKTEGSVLVTEERKEGGNINEE